MLPLVLSLAASAAADAFPEGSNPAGPSRDPHQAPAAETTPGPVRATELSAALVALSESNAYFGGRSGDLFAMLALDGRYLRGYFLGEASFVAGVPVTAGGSRGAAALVARVGASIGRFAGTIGALVNYAPTPAPFSPLPSLSLAVRVGPTVITAGIFDRLAIAPVRVGVEWRKYGVGWIFLIGGEAHGRFPVAEHLELEARVLAFSLGKSLFVAAAVGAAWDGVLP